ncbi:MAG: hypothetical protein HY064_09655 [Bacteroidetes bacterium]|nr:hypothetical protein [Bacteroidota bacterium]
MLFIAAFSFFVQEVFAQKILNGNFEDNSASECKTNLVNEEFSSFMKNCYAYGAGNELDIQDGQCGYGTPFEGKWFISLATPSGPDGFALQLSSPFISGVTYRISFEALASTMFGNGLDSLVFGVSDSKEVQGTEIFSIQPIQNDKWQKKEFSFKSPATGIYLTIQNKGERRAWNFIDDVKMVNDPSPINFSTSPVAGFVTVNEKEMTELRVVDKDGKIVKSEKLQMANEVEIDTTGFTEKNYSLVIVTRKKTLSYRFVNAEEKDPAEIKKED